MKRCPKCSRTFPDDNQKFCTIDGGLLVAGDKPFDPNATIQSTTAPIPPPQPPVAPPQPPKASEPDFGATIATSSTAPTAVLPKQTGPTGSVTAANLHQQQQQQPPSPSQPPPPAPTAALSQTPPPKPSAPLPPAPSAPLPPAQRAASSVPASAVAPPKKSKLPLILGILAVLLIFGVGAVVAAFFFVIKPRLDQPKGEPPVVTRETPTENVNTNTNANTNTGETTPEAPELVPPPNTTKFTNSLANLEGNLADHYFDFSFYYPEDWVVDPKAGTAGSGNFAKVERRLPPDFTQENFAVRSYQSAGTFAADLPNFPARVEEFSASLAKAFPEYSKVSDGPTKINSLDAYEFRWTGVSRGTAKGDIQLWGRVVFLPVGVEGQKDGAILSMFTTSLAPELSGIDDVGVKGQCPVILDTFRIGPKK